MSSSIKCSICALCLLALAACGGGGSSAANAPNVTPQPGGGAAGGGGASGGGTGGAPAPGVELEGGVSGSGWNRGTIQGFSSVIVNGIAMATESADIFVEGAPAAQNDLLEGQTVSIIGDVENAIATDVRYRADIKGPVTAITVSDPTLGTATLTVLGQLVRTNAATFFDDTSLLLIQAGDLLEVSGTQNAAGELVASYIDASPALTTYKVVGAVANVTATTFEIGGLSVNFANATLADFSGAAPANGDLVEVRGAAADFIAPDFLEAGEVERLPLLTINPSARVELEGYIDRFTSASDFAVNGRAVTTDAGTLFENGTAATLDLNVKVEVAGTVDDDGILLASTLTLKPTNAVRAEGVVQSVDIAGEQLTLLGISFDTRGTTRFEDDSIAGLNPLTLADLQIGDYVEVRGFIDGSAVVASEVERDDFDADARLRGPAANENEPAASFDILGVPIAGDANLTAYQNDDDVPVSQTQFHTLLEDGNFVDVKWQNFTNTSVVPDEISLELNDDD